MRNGLSFNFHIHCQVHSSSVELQCVCVRKKWLSFIHLWKLVFFFNCSVIEPLIVQTGICCRKQVCFVSFLVDWSACFLAFKKICLCIMCLHCKGLHVSLVCVNIPIVELLLSWLSLFHLSSIINDLLPTAVSCVNSEHNTGVCLQSKTFSKPAQKLQLRRTKTNSGNRS